jgi:hypothetical protein
MLILLAGCSRGPDWYAPPVQRQPLSVAQSSFLTPFVSMGDPNAEAYIIKDVSDTIEGGSWRWAYRRPELRFYLPKAEKLTFVMDFTLPRATFADTGPVTLSIFLNGKLLGRQRYDKPGDQSLKLPVPPALVKPHAINNVAIEPDKVWVAKQDGAVLGFVLRDAGFEE